MATDKIRTDTNFTYPHPQAQILTRIRAHNPLRV
jgi:hypothetical protein